MLDPDPNQKLFRDGARVNFLRQRAESPNEASSFAASQLVIDRAVRPSQLLLKSKFSGDDISNAVSRLAAEGKLVLAGEFAVDAATWRALRQRAADAIEAHHRAHPEQSAAAARAWRLAHLIVGVFGAGSKFSWQALAAFNYKLFVRNNITWSGMIGYKALHVDYSQGSGLTRYEYNMTMHGPILGLTARF